MEDVTLDQVIGSLFDYKMESINTAIPGIILQVHKRGEELFIDVQPSVSVRTQTDEIVHRPVLLNVPVQMPSSKLAGVLFPVSVGDTGLIIFSQDAMENFKYGDGKPTAPNDYRRYNLKDASFIPGVFPRAASPNRPARHRIKHDPEDLVVYHNLGQGSECEIRLKKASGDIEVTTPTRFLVKCKDMMVDAAESITLKTKSFKGDAQTFSVSSTTYTISTGSYSMNATTNATSSGTFSHNGNWTLDGIVMNTHQHSGVQPGGGNSGGPV